MKKYVLALLAMATALAITPCVSATSITGSIGITGSADTWSSTEITLTRKRAMRLSQVPRQHPVRCPRLLATTCHFPTTP